MGKTERCAYLEAIPSLIHARMRKDKQEKQLLNYEANEIVPLREFHVKRRTINATAIGTDNAMQIAPQAKYLQAVRPSNSISFQNFGISVVMVSTSCRYARTTSDNCHNHCN